MKGIIFDFNGTLFWDSEIQENAWKTFGKKLSGRDITDEEFNTYFHGRTNKDTLEYLKKRELTEEEVNELAQQKESIYRDLCKSDLSKFKLAPGVERYLNYLKASEALNIQPDNCIVFEDASSGIKSAKSAGVKEIIAVVPEGRRNIFENQPDLKIISTFDDIRLYDVEKYR